ncbi:cation diffusion facilitator family transporter [Oceanivirga salmonicida]|uniref:cation diffusion facilitator family transporter n=1 Tax=Oceanivirga salmonicida TaxID=1769291 RepID=UPI00082B9100|nr:cation diffusion facilitator family transporter [Oceanivirga salmonicida]
MSNKHEGHNHSVDFNTINKAFYIGIGLNIIFTLIEFIIGYSTNSLALISDASHNLSDVASLIISLIGLKLSRKIATKVYTYGYRKASILASLVNAILLIYIVFNIGMEAIKRFSSVPQITGSTIIITAIIGVIINSFSAFLFFKGQKNDINIKGAFLHLMLDAVVSVGVVISGIIIYYTNLNIVDPIISIVIAIVILFSTWNLLKESIKLTLDGVPKNISIKDIEKTFLKNEMIEEIHHLHVWAISSSQNALTVHIRLKKDIDIKTFIEVKNELKKELEGKNIQHATFEIDTWDYYCQNDMK